MPRDTHHQSVKTPFSRVSIAALAIAVVGTASAFVGAPKAKIQISVMDLTTGQPVAQSQTLTAGDLFQVTVTGNGADCAGQFVVTASGAPGFPPSVLVQAVPFVVGPAVGGNSAAGTALTATSLGSAVNDWKISASCNGPIAGQIDFDKFEFFAL